MAFPTTQWGILELLRAGDADQQSGALGEIITIYGPPLFAFARHESHGSLSRQDCEDVVEDFFLKCIEEDVLKRADPARGKFRNFLSRTFRNFMLNWIRDRGARKRTPPGGIVSLHDLVDKHGRAIEPRAGESVDDTFDRVLGVALFNHTLAEFEKACRAAGQDKKYKLYVRYEIEPEREGIPAPPYSVLADEFGLPSDDAVGRIIRAARDEFRSLLLARISRDSESSREAEVELRMVFATGMQG